MSLKYTEALEIAAPQETVLKDGWTLTKKLIAECESLRYQLKRLKSETYIKCGCCSEIVAFSDGVWSDEGTFCSPECRRAVIDELIEDARGESFNNVEEE